MIDLLRPEDYWMYLVIGGLLVGLIVGVIFWIVSGRRRRKNRELMSANTVAKKAHLRTPADVPLGMSAQEVGIEEFGLQFIQPSGVKQTFSSLPISIGRSPQNDIVLEDETVSAQHARVYYDEVVGAICVLDLDSANGISINGHPTRKNVLQSGAKLRLGEAQLEFLDTGYIHSDSP
jgi:hypothetical protein